MALQIDNLLREYLTGPDFNPMSPKSLCYHVKMIGPLLHYHCGEINNILPQILSHSHGFMTILSVVERRWPLGVG